MKYKGYEAIRAGFLREAASFEQRRRLELVLRLVRQPPRAPDPASRESGPG